MYVLWIKLPYDKMIFARVLHGFDRVCAWASICRTSQILSNRSTVRIAHFILAMSLRGGDAGWKGVLESVEGLRASDTSAPCEACAGILGDRGLGSIVLSPLGCVAKINTLWPWPWPWPWLEVQTLPESHTIGKHAAVRACSMDYNLPFIDACDMPLLYNFTTCSNVYACVHTFMKVWLCVDIIYIYTCDSIYVCMCCVWQAFTFCGAQKVQWLKLDRRWKEGCKCCSDHLPPGGVICRAFTL